MGGGGSPRVPTAAEEAAAQVTLERERAALAETKAAADRQRAKEEAAATAAENERLRQEKITKASGKQAAAYGYGQSYLNTELSNRGVDADRANKYGVNSTYMNELERARAGWDEEDTNPYASLSTTTWLDNALSNATNRFRTDTTKSINNNYGDGFENNVFADTMDDPFLADILDQQQEDAQLQIDAAAKRGQLSDVGLARANKGLGQSRAAGNAQLQSIGSGVLGNYRKDISGLRSNELTKIGSLGLGDNYDPSGFDSLLKSRIADYSGRLQGDILGATKGQTFFDPATLIAGAGALQGFYNPTGAAPTTGESNPLLNAFVDQTKKPTTATTGVF